MIFLTLVVAYPVIGYILYRLALLAEGTFTPELAKSIEKGSKGRIEFRNTVIAAWPLFLFTILVSFTIALFKKSWRDDGNFDK
jgi:hypothetical protein